MTIDNEQVWVINDQHLEAYMTRERNDVGDWIILITRASTWHAKTDVLPYSAVTWSALCHCLDNLSDHTNTDTVATVVDD